MSTVDIENYNGRGLLLNHFNPCRGAISEVVLIHDQAWSGI
jgi:hypothetical protein